MALPRPQAIGLPNPHQACPAHLLAQQNPVTESIAAEAFGLPFVARQPAVPEAVVVRPPLAAQPAVSVPAALEVAAAVVVSALLLGLAADEGLPAGEAAPLAAAGVAVAVDEPVPLVHEPAAPGATVSPPKKES